MLFLCTHKYFHSEIYCGSEFGWLDGFSSSSSLSFSSSSSSYSLLTFNKATNFLLNFQIILAEVHTVTVFSWIEWKSCDSCLKFVQCSAVHNTTQQKKNTQNVKKREKNRNSLNSHWPCAQELVTLYDPLICVIHYRVLRMDIYLRSSLPPLLSLLSLFFVGRTNAWQKTLWSSWDFNDNAPCAQSTIKIFPWNCFEKKVFPKNNDHRTHRKRWKS